MRIPKKMSKLLFPHEKPREKQEVFIERAAKTIESKGALFVQAPTGLGKTAAALAPAITYAIENDKKVFFLTSRYTQHILALETVQAINERHGTNIIASDIISKKNMCLYTEALRMSSGEFTSFCKKMRENHQCKYYLNTKKDNGLLHPEAKQTVEILTKRNPTIEKIKAESELSECCPYEIASEVAKKAHVIVGDYYYLFHPTIRSSFFRRLGIGLEDAIIVVDEAHNLPDRLKELASSKLTAFVVDNAIKEAQTFATPDARKVIEHIKSVLERFNDIQSPEQVVPRSWFIRAVEEEFTFKEAIAELDEATEIVLEQRQRSYIMSIHEFMVRWQTDMPGYVRIIRKDDRGGITLLLRCLDPRLMTADVKEEAHSIIMMSGTFRPLKLYTDLLGFEDAQQLTFTNPFPKHNALHLVVPETTTRYQDRSDKMFDDIAKHCSTIINSVPGNTAIFFPSYYLLQQIEPRIVCDKTVFTEDPSYTKLEREELLGSFKKYKDSGAVLLGAAQGSFGEGVDLPGDLLKCVIIVGLPLSKPDLETNQLIKYYDEQFGNGWDYGYIIPAFNTLLQNSGRCIRSDTDKGIVIYLDSRFGWPKYLRYFPEDINLRVTANYQDDIRRFFENDNS